MKNYKRLHMIVAVMNIVVSIFLIARAFNLTGYEN